MPDKSKPAWYVVHSRPKCEHIAAGLMAGLEGVKTYCPRIRFQKSTRRGKVWFVEALFPSYFFAHFNAAEMLRAVKHSQSVIRVVGFGESLARVDDAVIEQIKAEMTECVSWRSASRWETSWSSLKDPCAA
jgi:transcription antitermination factor NusG